MDQYDLDFESILHNVDATKLKWTEASEKYKSMLSSLKETNAKYEQTKIELESYKVRAKKAETEKENMMVIVKELYKERRLTNPFSETLNKLERLILAAQNDSTQKNNTLNSSISEIPFRIVSSDTLRDNTQQPSVDSEPLPIMQFKSELAEITDSSLNQDQDSPSLMANDQTLSISINPNSIRCLRTTSTPLVHPDQRVLLNDESSQDETSEHGVLNKNESSYEFVEIEPGSSEVIPQMQNNHVDVDPLSLSDKSSCIRKPLLIKPLRSLRKDNQQETPGSDAMNVKVSLPRINVSSIRYRNSRSNDNSIEILKACSSSTAVLEKHPNESELISHTPCSRKLSEANDMDIKFDDDVDEDDDYWKPRRCLICKKNNSKNILYATYQDLDDHIVRYHPEPLPMYRRCPYEGGKCRRHFAVLKELQKHIKLCHQNEMFVKSNITNELPKYVVRRCLICDELFLNYPDLKNHMNEIHNGGSGPIKCQTCGVVLSTMNGLSMHKAKGRCNRKISEKSNLSFAKSQFVGYSSKCKICLKENPQEETCYTRKNLDAHIMQNHPNFYPDYIRCPHQKGDAECNRHLISMRGYCLHVKMYHREEDLCISLEKAFPGQKPFKCSVCDKFFVSKAHLIRHSQLYCKRAKKPFALRKRRCTEEQK